MNQYCYLAERKHYGRKIEKIEDVEHLGDVFASNIGDFNGNTFDRHEGAGHKLVFAF